MWGYAPTVQCIHSGSVVCLRALAAPACQATTALERALAFCLSEPLFSFLQNVKSVKICYHIIIIGY
jgi:hypothetical protein